MTDTPALRRSFRLVCNPGQIPSVEALLSAQGFVFEPEPFSPLARRLLQEPFPLGRSLAAFWGYVYIQDRSSMLPPLALAPGEGARVLDMCASPGSKTGLLAQLVGREGLVLGVGAKLFSIAGPVLSYGISASVIYGLIFWLTEVIG